MSFNVNKVIHQLQNLSHTYTMANTELVVTNQERYIRVVAESPLTSLA